MRKLITAFSFLLIAACASSQQLRQVNFSGGATLSALGFLTDQDVLIRISDEGKVLEWGTEARAIQGDYYAPRLQPFMGRVDYYGTEADSSSMGKIKSIGTCMITYYGGFETETRKGKIRTIGNLMFDYYSHYDNVALRGKIRSAGNHLLEYHSSFENEAIKGKLKSVGNTAITYYSTFDDKLIRGKVKSIGAFAYKWYTSLDQRGYGGALKSGSYRQQVNGITYILQY
jgi:hypothetical protein